MMDLTTSLIKLHSQTAGRDKICRIIQYGSKFVWWYLERSNKDFETIKKIKELEYSVSTTRKLMRFGKSIDILHSALRSIHIQDLTLRLTLTFSKISQALYLLLDNILWLERVKLLQINKQSWTNLANKYWLVMLILNLTRDINDLYRSITREIVHQNIQNQTNITNYTNEKKSCPSKCEIIVKCLKDNKCVVLDTLKNTCDIVLPMNRLGYTLLSPGVEGICGLVSSILGIITLLDPMLKLVPS